MPTSSTVFPGFVYKYISPVFNQCDKTFTIPQEDDITKTKTPNWEVVKWQGGPFPVNGYKRVIRRGYIGVRFIGHQDVHWLPKAVPWNSDAQTNFNFYYGKDGFVQADIDAMLNKYRAPLINEANAILQKRLSETKVQSIVEIGEAHKTLKMLTDCSFKTAQFIENFGKSKRYLYNIARKYKASRSLAKPGSSTKPVGMSKTQLYDELRNAYLEFTYGWVPLESSVEGTMQAVYDHFHAHSPRAKVSAHAVNGNYPDDFVKGCSVSVNAFRTFDYRIKSEFQCDVWVGGLLTPTQQLQKTTLQSRFGLTAGDIPKALYDLTPYSFLLDYVSNLGSVVNNLGMWLNRLRSGYTYQTTKMTCKQSMQIENMQPFWDRTDSFMTLNATATPFMSRELIYFERKATTIADHIVTLQLETPSWHQLLNSVALIKANTRTLRL